MVNTPGKSKRCSIMTFMGWKGWKPYHTIWPVIIVLFFIYASYPAIAWHPTQSDFIVPFYCHNIVYLHGELFKTAITIVLLFRFNLLKESHLARCCLSLNEKQHYFYPTAQCMSSHINIFLTPMFEVYRALEGRLHVLPKANACNMSQTML